MKKSFFKRIVSLLATFAIILSIGGMNVSAASYYDRYEEPQYQITVYQSSLAHGYIAPTVPRAHEGDIVEIEVTTDDDYILDQLFISWYEEGYRREIYLYEEDMVRKISNDTGVWEFRMPAANVTISGEVEKDWRKTKIDVKIDEDTLINGEVFSNKYRAVYGDEITLTAVPEYGYRVEYLKVNNVKLEPTSVDLLGSTDFSYIVTSNRITVKASFVRAEKDVYTIDLNTKSGGTASLNMNSANYGQKIILTVTPDEGMIVDTVKYGTTVLNSRNNVYSFTMPPQDIKLTVTFKSDGTGSYVPSVPSDSSNPTVPTWVQVGNQWRIKNIDGSYITGWHKINGQWYYMDRAGDMLTGWIMLSKNWYYLKSSGAMATGWQLVNGSWYYLKSSGAMATGWNWIGNKCYYFYSSGKMASGTTINGYKLDASGAWIR